MMSPTSLDRKELTHLRTPWSSVAFIVESVLLLLFLVASLAVLTKIFSASLNHSVESRTLDAATIAASSIAEHFAADPNSVEERTVLGDLVIMCTVTDEERPGGTMKYADIRVYDTSEKNTGSAIYTISTSHYESDGEQ